MDSVLVVLVMIFPAPLVVFLGVFLVVFFAIILTPLLVI